MDTENNPIHGSTTLDDVNVNETVQPAATFGPPGIAASDDPLGLVIGTNRWEGWQKVTVTRSMETVPANFSVQVTERYPKSGKIDIKPGDPVKVMIGQDLAITGYIDRYAATLTPTERTIRIVGRSKSADLVDCAAFFGSPDKETYNHPAGSPVEIIKKLAAGYKIDVASTVKDVAPLKTPLNINLGETAWEIIDRLVRYSQLVAYDMPDGSMMLAQSAKEQMASGFVQGQNIEAAEVTYSMDQRYSLYEGFQTATVSMTLDGGQMTSHPFIARDNDVPRFRKKIIISEQADAQGPLVQKRVDWEMARRKGRSLAVALTCDSWRDRAGKLWAPNHLAPVEIPELKITKQVWCIGAVTYTRDETGQHALLILMPPDAFLPEPSAYMPLPLTLSDIGAAPGGNNPTDPQAGTGGAPTPAPEAGGVPSLDPAHEAPT